MRDLGQEGFNTHLSDAYTLDALHFPDEEEDTR